MKSLRHRYAELESVQCWKQVAALDVQDFAGILLGVHVQYNDTWFFIPGSNWNVPRTWQHMWRTTFQLDTVMGMAPCNTYARRVTATVPVETLLGCVPEKLWVFTSPEPCPAFGLFSHMTTYAPYSNYTIESIITRSKTPVSLLPALTCTRLLLH